MANTQKTSQKNHTSMNSNSFHKTLLLRLLVIIFTVSSVLFITSKAHAETYPFYVQIVYRGETTIEVKATNGGNVPIILKINPLTFDGYKYTSSNKPSRDTAIVVDKLSKKTVLTVVADRGVNIHDYKFNYAWTFGNPKKAQYMDYIYSMPYDKMDGTSVEKLYKADEENNQKRYRHAYKFTGQGGNIITSRPGIVFDLRAYDTEVPNKSDVDIMGFVRVLHTDGTWSEYFNIPYDTIQVKINDYLPEGRVIAKADTFAFAIMLPTTDGIPLPIQYTMNLETGGKINTSYITDSLNLEQYNPEKYRVTSWYQTIIKAKSNRKYLIGAAVVLVVVISVGIYFYITYRKKKALAAIQALHVAADPVDDDPDFEPFSEERLAEIEEPEDDVFDRINQMLEISSNQNQANEKVKLES
ncbi:MAG: hypothetical protein ACTS9Y_00075 [Methylophilus sp.]|uniref:hypothetical protein n=1 Tax=Methylophilus sp. TaxID=29541 RepID=UPI003F9F5714